MKKKIKNRDRCRLLKLLRVMRIAVFLLVLSLMHSYAASSYGQSSVRMNLKMEGATLEPIFAKIESETGFHFFYQSEDLKTDKTFDVDAKDRTVFEILDMILPKAGLSYQVFDKYIAISSLNSNASVANATQQKTVQGKVTDSSGQPLPGVSVVVKGTTTGTISDFDGKYTLINVPGDATLVFSFVGFKSQEIQINNNTNIDIQMVQDVIGLDEVVAIGYGVAKKSDLTGAITQVKIDDLKKYTPANVSDLLRTTVPGLNVSYSSSAKGNSSFLIRGETTLTAGATPLIVLDGVIYNGDISDINPNDIERLDVLKDASSAAIYGSRATNGVIVITTTKTGLTDKPTITFNSNIGVATAANRLDPYDAEGFIKWRSDMFKSVYSATVPSDQWSPFDDPRTIDPQYLNDWFAYHSTNEANMVDAWLAGLRLTATEIENYKAGRTQDWEDVIYRNGLRQDYNISLSGRKTNFTYYWSLGYMNNEALAIGDEFSTIRSRVNIEGQVAKFLKVGLNAQFSFRDESPALSDYGQYKHLTPYGLYFADDSKQLRLYPNDEIHSKHPLLGITYSKRENQYYTFFPKIYSILNLPFGITYTVNYTTRLDFWHNYVHNSSEHPEWALFGGSASRASSITREWQIDNIINWNHTFNDRHRFDVTLLANAEKNRFDSDKMDNRYFSPNDVLGYHDMSTGTLPVLASNDDVETADALMARLNYGLDSKYLLTLSVRRDGSSLFGYSNPRATFPAVALGWVVSEENFFSSDFINYLKIRASWGANGNRSISNYAALSRIATGKALNSENSGVAYIVPTLLINTMENKNLRWEQTEAFNIGLDYNLFDGVLSGTIEGYDTKTTDVLVNRELPSITGFDRVYANLGEVRNKGLEFTLNSVNIKRNNFEWRTNFIFSLNRNKIVSITGEKYDVFDIDGNLIGQKEPDDKDNNWFIGKSKHVIWDYKILGTWKTGEEAEAANWNQAPGDFRLEDFDGNGILTDEDKQFLGDRDPHFRWTMTNNLKIYKNWEASFVMYSLWGQMSSYALAKHDDHIEDRKNTWDIPYWTPENQTNKFARLHSAPPKGVSYNVWFDRSYIRLENIAVSYMLPQTLLNRTFIQTCKLSFNIRNAALWAPEWKFGDPEEGVRAQRIFTFGFNMTI
ncbi:MAG: TonB-dependent receptor [Prolixibacteraceae bacterium]|jgi:TonB-linked SusC/RagA family outer membrane protein|nr:TonB-dependent receptor [Prolixibacteraceae bacterium]